jgi:hypothetical protein
MSDKTSIQWSDSTINPIMGCGGCELFPPPGEVLADINRAAAQAEVTIDSKAIFKALVDDCFAKIRKPGPEFKRVVNTTNIWHLRKQFAEKIRRDHGTAARDAVELAISRAITCYAAKLHLNKAFSIVNPTRHPHKGYAPLFEKVTRFPGRVAKAASSLSALTIAERREDEARGENRARSAVDANISRSPSAENDIPSG